MENETAAGKSSGEPASGERRGPGTYPGAPELKAGPPSHLELATFQRPPNCEPPQVAGKPFTSPFVVDSSRRGQASTRNYKMSRHPGWGATSARTWGLDAGKIPRAPTGALRGARGGRIGSSAATLQVSGKPNLTLCASASRRSPAGPESCVGVGETGEADADAVGDLVTGVESDQQCRHRLYDAGIGERAAVHRTQSRNEFA